MEKERIIQGASVCDKFEEDKDYNENEHENIEDQSKIQYLQSTEINNEENQDNQDNKKDSENNENKEEDSANAVNMKFEYCISEPITQITEEKFTQLYDEHLKWLEALLNPNKKVFRGRMNLSGADLSGRNLDGLNLSGGSFVGSSFVGASLVGTNFTGADLSGADFSNAVFSNTKFKRAVLNRAMFTNENKEGIDITLASTIGTVWSKKEESVEEENKDIGTDNVDVDVGVVDENDNETTHLSIVEEG